MKKQTKYALLAFFFVILAIPYILHIGNIPLGVFCDEAEIGNLAHKLLQKDTSFFVNPFFYNHFNYMLGALPIYATVPFVALLGINEFSLRFVSVFYALASLGLITFLLYKIEKRPPLIAVLAFAMTPLFLHLSKINFGHQPSFFFVVVSYTLFFLAKEKKNLILAGLSGLSLGIAAYGHASFLLFTLSFMTVLVISEIILNKLHFKKYTLLLSTLMLFCIAYSPIIYTASTNQNFWQRLQDKDATYKQFSFTEKVSTMLKNYPKYYSVAFLTKGEPPKPSQITRHLVPGNGFILPVIYLIMLLSALYFIVDKSKRKQQFLPFFLLLILYPLPDLITTKTGDEPYSFSLFGATIIIPFLVSYAILSINEKHSIPRIYRKGIIISIFILILIGAISFYKNYLAMPYTTSNYWGWQYGPQKVIEYFITHNNEYDELYMSGLFNQPSSLMKFYDPEGKCTHCRIGGMGSFNPAKRQLFAFRAEELEKNDLENLAVTKIIYFPNGQKAFIIGYPTQYQLTK